MTQAGNGLRGELRSFVAEHPDGWGHGHWETLLRQLEDSGFDTGRPDAIGAELERERVLVVLEESGVRGLGPKRREAVADGFGTLWRLRHASVDDLSALPGLTRDVAERLHTALGS